MMCNLYRKYFDMKNYNINKLKQTDIRVKNSSGFTLIETIVAIVILLGVVVFAFNIAFRGTVYAELAKDQVIATFLAQDALDYVIFQKKQNIISEPESDWLNGFGDCKSSNGCSIDTTVGLVSGAVKSCDSDCENLKLSSDGRYRYGGSDDFDTKFERKITIEDIENGVEARVSVEITWRSGLFSDGFIMSTNIFNTQF